MKTLKLYLLAAIALLVAACSQKPAVHYAIDVDLTQMQPAGVKIDSIVFSANHVVFQTLDSMPDYKAHVEGDVDAPCLGQMTVSYSLNGQRGAEVISMVLEEGTITYSLEEGYVQGTPQNDAVHDFWTKMNPDSLDINEYFKQFVETHKGELCVASVLSENAIAYYVDAQTIEEAVATLTEDQKQSPEIKALMEKIEAAKKTAEGQMFTDFEAEYEGNVQHLSDYVGKGKYVLVDFWASWCGPCRAEIPNLIKVYNEYAGEKLDVLGVATWDEPDATKEAIAELGIPYPQIMNAQKAGSDAYSIEGIPEIILFGPDGTILKRGLRGEQIEATIKEYLEKE